MTINKPSKQKLKNFMKDKTNKQAANYFKISERTIARLIKKYNLNYEEMKYGSYLPFNLEQKELMVASLLGDGCIEKTGRFKLGQTLVGSKKEYVTWVHDKFSPYSKRVYKDDQSFRFYTVTHSIFKNLRKKWYPDGKKIIPRDIVITPYILAHWHIQDGSNNQGKKSIRISTDCFTKNDVNFLRYRIFKDLKVNTTLNTKLGKYSQIHIGAYEYFRVIDLIQPYITFNCFKYFFFRYSTFYKAYKFFCIMSFSYSGGTVDQYIFYLKSSRSSLCF